MQITLYSPQILIKPEFLRTDFQRKTQILSFVKIRPVGAELFHADERMDGHDEAHTRFSQSCERA